MAAEVMGSDQPWQRVHLCEVKADREGTKRGSLSRCALRGVGSEQEAGR